MIYLFLLTANFTGDLYWQGVLTQVPRVELTDIRFVNYRSNTLRALFQAKSRIGPLRVRLQASHQLWVANPYGTEFNWQLISQQSHGFVNLHALCMSDNAIQMDQLRRASISYQSRRWGLRLGRGVVSWNSTFFWSALNIFTVQNNISGVPDDVPFCDFVDLSLRPVSWLSSQLIYSPREQDSSSRAYRTGLRILLNSQAIDLGLQLSYNRGDSLVGGLAAFNLFEGSLRAEAGFRPSGSPSYVLSYDRRWPGGFYGVMEYYKNGKGTSFARPGAFSKRDYMGLFANKVWDVVWAGSVYYINCLSDGSWLVGGFVSRSFGQNYQISAGLSYPHGKSPTSVFEQTSDFGLFRPAGFIGLEYWF